LNPDLPALSKGDTVYGQICSAGSPDYSTSLKSFISISRDMYKNQLSLQLSSVTMDVKAVYYCVRNTMKGLSWEP
jgi:hypothetical protein